MNKTSLFIATPGYQELVTFQYARSLGDTYALVRSLGITLDHAMFSASSLLCKCRNLLIKKFMETDATHMLCIDADLGWPAEAVLGMMRADKDIVVGLYPARGLPDKFFYRPVTNENDCVVIENNLMRLTHAPAGFMLIKRESIQRMIDKYPERYANPKDPRNKKEDMYVFFNTEMHEGEFWGEDYMFCRLATEAGLEIWADLDIVFDHAGTVGNVRTTLIPVGSQSFEVGQPPSTDVHFNMDNSNCFSPPPKIEFDLLKDK